MKDEIILYRFEENDTHIEVKVNNETVWLNRQQIASLFDRDVKTIGKHINNVFSEEELVKNSTVAIFATVQNEGGRKIERLIEYYNLDVIISVGYRVKSKQGTQFRIWANNILKDYLMKGYAVNNRMNRLEDNMEFLKNKMNEIDLQINTKLIPTQGIFFDGQVFDAYEFTSKIIRTAKQNIILIDNYVDDITLTHLAKKNENVLVSIYTKNINKQMQLDIQKANEQYGDFTIKEFGKSHDRFLIIDSKEVYHLGASLKDLGKKWFAFSKMDRSFVGLILDNINK